MNFTGITHRMKCSWQEQTWLKQFHHQKPAPALVTAHKPWEPGAYSTAYRCVKGFRSVPSKYLIHSSGSTFNGIPVCLVRSFLGWICCVIYWVRSFLGWVCCVSPGMVSLHNKHIVVYFQDNWNSSNFWRDFCFINKGIHFV